jgi:hypothetical protein
MSRTVKIIKKITKSGNAVTQNVKQPGKAEEQTRILIPAPKEIELKKNKKKQQNSWKMHVRKGNYDSL